MGCGDECPFIMAENREDWKLDDPKNMDPTEFNNVRDEIERRVKLLISSLVD
jgi:protein-tyrosine-phosphatase